MNHLKDVSVYKIIDALTKEVYYIGATIQPLENRLYAHTTKSTASQKMYRLIQSGVKFEIILIETCPRKDAASREKFWYDHYKNAGVNLANGDVYISYSVGIYSPTTLKNRSIKIDQYSLKRQFIQTFENIDAVTALGFHEGLICRVLVGWNENSQGFKWAFHGTPYKKPRGFAYENEHKLLNYCNRPYSPKYDDYGNLISLEL